MRLTKMAECLQKQAWKKNTFKSESESESWLAREKEISERNTGIKQYSYLFIIAE